MKLYTEEQIRKAIMIAENKKIPFTTIVTEHLTPIELPSDDIKDNIIMLLKEDLECINKYLDELKINNQSEDGKEYSVVGRIKQLQKKQLQELSNLENYYIENKSILLPSDEEIEQGVNCSNLGLKYDYNMSVGFKKGAKWMRDKIQGGNK